MEANLSLGETATYKLAKALLIYEAESTIHQTFGAQTRVAVTAHDITNGVIEAGQPVTYAAVESLAAALGRNLAAGWLPPHVLSVGFGQIAWFCPAARRRLWFKPDGRFNGGGTKDNSETARVMKLNGKFAQHPPLLFIARDRGLTVFALADNVRPAADTKLYRAPYWNLWEGGALCAGNRKLADQPVPASIPSFEDGFFNSAFSHTNITKICNYPGGHAELWKVLADGHRKPPAPKFWTKHLIPLKRTVATAITSKQPEE